MTALHRGLVAGLAAARERAAASGQSLATIGVDTWGVDYGLIDAGGAWSKPRLPRPAHRGRHGRVFARVPRAEIFRQTGIQFIPFNTIYQLAAHVRDGSRRTPPASC